MNKCEICKNDLVTSWTDLHGEGICWICETPYQIIQYDEHNNRIKDAMPKINIKDEFIPFLKKYWDETEKGMGLGTYLLRNPHQENATIFYAWLDKELKNEQQS